MVGDGMLLRQQLLTCLFVDHRSTIGIIPGYVLIQ